MLALTVRSQATLWSMHAAWIGESVMCTDPGTSYSLAAQTGLCVYEVDDPNQRYFLIFATFNINIDVYSGTRDQMRNLVFKSALPNWRVSFARSVSSHDVYSYLNLPAVQLKNKPHPRWAQGNSGDLAQKNNPDTRPKSTSSASPSRSSSEGAPSSPTGPILHLLPPTAPSSSRASPIDTMMSGSSSSSSSYSSPSPLDTPSPLTLTPVDVAGDYDLATLLSSCYPDATGLDGALDSLFDGLIRPEGLGGMGDTSSCLGMQHDNSHIDGHCGCLGDTSSYNVVLELSLRLRRAAETLGHFPKHRTPSSCPIHQRIAELDRCTRYVLY